MKTRDQNSLVGVISALLVALRQDLQRIHPAHSKALVRDFATIERRLRNEGLFFVTSTLPALGKSVLQSFLSGRLEAPQGFKKLRGTTLPILLSGLLVQGYENDGSLRQDCCPTVIRSLLQVVFLCYKLELPFTEEQISSKLEGFLKAELDLRGLTLDGNDVILSKARSIIQGIFREFNPREMTPKHGPGALATGEKAEGKWCFKRKYANLHAYYPYYEYFTPSRSSLLANIKAYKALDDCDRATSKMAFVPKDSRGPRIISMEPLELQFAQQGLKDALYKHIEKHPITKGFVNFSDQTINGKLAKIGSTDGSLATLDMKEASDRVSLSLVKTLFHGTELLNALLAVRSQACELSPECGEHAGKIVELYKYAPMGSATCFPVEAICFFALSCAIILYKRGHMNANRLPRVYVYGDDIIVNVEDAETLKEFLPKYGLLVNTDKSYDRGPFRESCGSDCFRGEIVTPIKLRKLWPEDNTPSPTTLASYAEYANAFYASKYFCASSYLSQLPSMRALTRRPLKSRSGTAIRRVDSFDEKTRWSKKFQRVEVLSTTIVSRKRPTKIDSYERLFANVVNQLVENYEVPYASDLKLRWVVKDESTIDPTWVERLSHRHLTVLCRSKSVFDIMCVPAS